MIYIGLIVFVSVFYLMITEKVPAAWATMIGGLIMSLIGIINQEEALNAVADRLEILLLLVVIPWVLSDLCLCSKVPSQSSMTVSSQCTMALVITMLPNSCHHNVP